MKGKLFIKVNFKLNNSALLIGQWKMSRDFLTHLTSYVEKKENLKWSATLNIKIDKKKEEREMNKRMSGQASSYKAENFNINNKAINYPE